MYEPIKNLRHKEYNPCGDLTGRERELCDEATRSYFNLPYVEVMRTISIKAVAELEHETNFRNAELEHETNFRNVAALENWATYNLNDVERRANLNFDTFTPLQAGLCKYLVHVLYENRYNIHYNSLLNYCGGLDAKAFPENLTAEQLEQKIDSLAQSADYFSRVNALIEELWNFFKA